MAGHTRWRRGARSYARLTLTLILGLLTLAWAVSVLLPIVAPTAAPVASQQALISSPSAPPDWRDTLILDVTLRDISVQQQVALINWLSQDQRPLLRLFMRADGQSHRYIIPIGAHPDWDGDSSNLRLDLPPQVATQLTINGVSLIKRPPSAIDALLLRALLPFFPDVPPWPNVVLVLAAVLGVGLALAVPLSHWRRRLAVLALLLAGSTGAATVVAQFTLLQVLLPIYGPLDERAALERTPALIETTAINPVLLAAHESLPNGPVLALGFAPGGGTRDRAHLIYWARYLFYPRRIDAIETDLAPPELARLVQEQGYVGVIQRRDSGMPPLPGWQRVAAPSNYPVIWQAPDLPPLPAQPPGNAALLRLLLALALASAVGWGLAGLLGWRGAEGLAAAWPLGAVVAAIWLFLLALLRLPWSLLSVGLPLLGAALALGAIAWQHRRPTPQQRRSLPRSWELAGLLLILVLLVAVSIQAVLLPFTDQDTWTNWGLKGKAFYLDSALAPVMLLYQQFELYHMGYPPAQPLVQALGYLAMGGLSERLVKLIFPLWYGSGLALLYLGCRQWNSSRMAMGWTLLLATTPIMLDHATIANADLALSVGWLLGALALTRWIDSGTTRWLLAGTVALGSAAWIKLDGTYMGVAIIGAATLARFIVVWRNASSRWASLGAGVAAVLGCLLLIAPWNLYINTLDLRSELPSTELLQQEGIAIVGTSLALMAEQLLFSHSNSAWGLLGSGYGALWLICAGVVAANWRALRHDPAVLFLGLVVVGGIIFYAAIYTVEPFISIDRYLLHLAPIAVLAAARSLRQEAAVLPVDVLPTPPPPVPSSREPQVAPPTRRKASQRGARR